MNNYQAVFQRREQKYLLTRLQYNEFSRLVQGKLAVDAYGLHTIANLYLDTKDFLLIRRSLEKPVYKEKLRLRSYGILAAENPVYLEIKKKCQGIVSKRRIRLPWNQAGAFVRRPYLLEEQSQISAEIGWALQRYLPEAKVMLAYDRVAYTAPDHPELRVTLDQDIRFRQSVLDLSKGAWGKPLLPPERLLMEIKTAAALPPWLSRTLSYLEIYPASFSKYGYCYLHHLTPKKTDKEETCCA